jgi:hypothetical protein
MKSGNFTTKDSSRDKRALIIFGIFLIIFIIVFFLIK